MSTLLLYLAIVLFKQENTCKVLNSKQKFSSLSLLMTRFSLVVRRVIWSRSTENQEYLEFMISLTNDWLAQRINVLFSLLLFGISLGVFHTLFSAFLCGLKSKLFPMAFFWILFTHAQPPSLPMTLNPYQLFLGRIPDWTLSQNSSFMVCCWGNQPRPKKGWCYLPLQAAEEKSDHKTAESLVHIRWLTIQLSSGSANKETLGGDIGPRCQEMGRGSQRPRKRNTSVCYTSWLHG